MNVINKILSLFNKNKIILSDFDNKFGFMLKHKIVEEFDYNKVKKYYNERNIIP